MFFYNWGALLTIKIKEMINLHIYEMGNPEIERHLAFRDYLRVHPDYAKKYGDLKEKLSQRFPYEIGSYIKGKEQLAFGD